MPNQYQRGHEKFITIALSFPPPLLEEITALSKREHRTRAELLRESARMYIKEARRARALDVLQEPFSEKNK